MPDTNAPRKPPGRHVLTRLQHVAERADILRVFGTGQELEFLCGVKAAPTEEGTWKVAACKDCISLMADTDTLTPFRKEPRVTWAYNIQTSWEPGL